MLDFFMRTVEFQNFGLNAATIGAVGTICFTCWQLWSLWDQYRQVETGEAVSVGWHTYFAADFASFIIYGLYSLSIAMSFNALLGLGHLLVLWALFQCKRFRWWERAMLPLLIIFPVLMYFSRTYVIDLGFVEVTERQLLFFVITLGTLVALALQPLEMYRTKSRGDVSFHLLFTYTAATGFWIVYAFFGTDDVVLRFLTVTAGVLLASSLGLWFYYKPQSANAVT